MITTKSDAIWQQLPPPVVPSPVFALAAGRGGVWAGGVGGIARYAVSEVQSAWEPGVTSLPLSAVTTLLAPYGVVLAGGSEGIAYSYNNGKSWRRAQLEDSAASITALAASPNFAGDHTAIAATLENGILRTNDGGQTWTNASFGLESLEVTALTWVDSTTILAATGTGIYRSRDAGRGWKRLYLDDEAEIEALTALPDGTLLAALANGGLLRSRDDGRRWTLEDPLARSAQALSLFVTQSGTLLLGTLEHGLLRSNDAGATWQVVHERAVHMCAQRDGYIYAGTDTGVSLSLDDGLTWNELPCPPVHDLRILLARDGHLLLAGPYSGIMQATGAFDWEPLQDVPQPLTALAFAPDNGLFLSSPDGLVRFSLESGEWQILIDGQAGQVAYITMRQEGTSQHIWAASADGTRLLHSIDNGASWQQLPAPFGVLLVVALQATTDRLLAATYDPRQNQVCFWNSTDGGKTWTRGMEATTNWPLVATCSEPAALSVGNILFIEQAAGQWRKVTVGSDSGAIRRVIGTRLAGKRVLLALTTTGIQRSEDLGETWQQENASLPIERIVDIAADGETLFALLSGGQVWKRALQKERELV